MQTHIFDTFFGQCLVYLEVRPNNYFAEFRSTRKQPLTQKQTLYILLLYNFYHFTTCLFQKEKSCFLQIVEAQNQFITNSSSSALAHSRNFFKAQSSAVHGNAVSWDVKSKMGSYPSTSSNVSLFLIHTCTQTR